MAGNTKKEMGLCAKRSCETGRWGGNLLCHTHWREERDKDQSIPRCEWVEPGEDGRPGNRCGLAREANGLCHAHALRAAKLPLDHPDRPTCWEDGRDALVVVGDLRGGVCERHGQERALALPPDGTITDIVPHLRIMSAGGGYMRVFCPWHPFADARGYVCVHRLMGNLLGLFDDLISAGHDYMDIDIHHRNRVRDENSVSNLAAMLRGDHCRLHAAEERADKLAAEELAITA